MKPYIGPFPGLRFVVHILAAVAEQEAEAISKRTMAALAAARERGTKLGGWRVSAERFAAIGAEGRKLSAKVRSVKARAELRSVTADIMAAGATTLNNV